MNTLTLGLSLKKTTLMAAIAIGLAIPSAHSLTYTAIASGNFTSNSTWSGGLAPSTSISSDVVVIPSGITVTLDQNVVFSSITAALTVNGTLNSSTSKGLILANSALTGSGTLNLDSLVLSTASGFAYTGSITAKTLVSTGVTLATAASITVTNTLRLAAGTLAVTLGSLNMAANSTIEIAGGLITSGSTATIGLANSYNLRYTGSTNMTTGLELNGTGLTNIEVATSASAGIALNSDLVVRGTLTLTSGYLRLNSRNLTFSNNGNFSASGSGSIVATSTSNITLNSSSSFTGGLRFRLDSNMINNLTVNMASAGASARVGSHLQVGGTLALTSGRLDLDSNTLSLTANLSGAVSGGSSNSYVITRGNGRLGLNIGAGATGTFHVGTDMYYAPATISANSGNNSGMLSIGVNDSVRAQGTAGAAFSATRKVVNATWHVTSASSSNININLTTMWSANMEVNGFNRSQAYISHYMNGSWDATASTSATTAANGMYGMSRSNVTSLSPFAVVDRDYALSVPKYTHNDEVKVFPNPAINTLTISSGQTFNSINIYSADGILIKSVPMTGSAVNIETLPAGFYYAAFSNDNGAWVQQFTKL